MEIIIDEFYKEFYEQGHLGYVFDCMNRAGSYAEYVEFLKHEPVGMFVDTDNWSYDDIDRKVIYDDGEAKEEYSIGLAILLGEDIIFHCPEGNQSFFYKLASDNSVTALYVD